MPKSNSIPWPKPVIGLAGYSGSGKTTLLCEIIDGLTQRGVRVAVVKHTHHHIEFDKPGKDSYRLRHQGALQTLIATPSQAVLFLAQPDSDNLDEQLRLLDWSNLDCVFVEGYRHSAIPKLEIHRPSLNKPLLCENDPNIFAIATDEALSGLNIPIWPLNNHPFVIEHLIEVLIQHDSDFLTHELN
jgi:molybdopterin-guanine dinucleotide biosynthesis protein MobB